MPKKSSKRIAFVTFSGKALKERPAFYRALVKAMEKGCNCVVKYRWFESKRKKTPKEIFETSLASIREADFCIVEASFNSIGVGQQIAYTTQLKKPIIICLDVNANKGPSSSFLKGTYSSNTFFVNYISLKDLEGKLQKAVGSLEHLALEKFNFLASKRQKEFLLTESERRNISKSEFLRMIIDEWMEKDIVSKKEKE